MNGFYKQPSAFENQLEEGGLMEKSYTEKVFFFNKFILFE